MRVSIVEVVYHQMVYVRSPRMYVPFVEQMLEILKVLEILKMPEIFGENA